MTVRTARVLTYVVVAILAFFALQLTPPIARPPAEVVSVSRPEPEWKQTIDTLHLRETLPKVLRRNGMSDSLVLGAVAAVTSVRPSKLPAGMPVTVRSPGADSAPSEIVLELSIDHRIRLKRDSTGWSEIDERLAWKMDTVFVEGTIHSNMYRAMDAAAATTLPSNMRDQLTWTLADIYESKVDMSRDLQDGDTFRVMTERLTLATGAVKIGRIIATTFKLSGRVMTAVRYASGSVKGEYFDDQGKSLRSAFLHAPVEFRYISSAFGLRLHPILGIMRSHKGTDYAAASGTKVRSIGDGVVTSADWVGGYGNMVEIRHPNGYVTRYGHLRAFASGIHAGTRVVQGSTIGFVGMTGLATGPHVHFELLIGGEQRDPKRALSSNEGLPIPAIEKVAFLNVRDHALTALDSGIHVTTVAQR